MKANEYYYNDIYLGGKYGVSMPIRLSRIVEYYRKGMYTIRNILMKRLKDG